MLNPNLAGLQPQVAAREGEVVEAMRGVVVQAQEDRHRVEAMEKLYLDNILE